MLRLSQGHLNLLEICPPKFKQSYLDRVSSLPNPETEEKQAWGQRFHLLMQQRELGLPINLLLQKNTELDRSLKALIEVAPELIVIDTKQKREAEHALTLNFNNYLLTVIYDLLIAEPDRARIIDWKTYLQPPNKGKLARNWQTRLYLYVLVATSDYVPEQVSMTYWFVKLPNKPKSETFFYNSQLHQQTHEDLTELLTNFDSWLNSDRDNSFPHHSNCESCCPYYQELQGQNTRHNSHNASQQEQLRQQIDNISEVPL